jgi:hypothetical protein
MSSAGNSRKINRRALFKTAAVAGALGAAGTATMRLAGAAEPGAAGVTPRAFAHPGLLHTQADFDRMAAKVEAGAEPWKAGWDKLVANGHSQSSWKARPLETVIRGGEGQNYPQLYNDIHAAYQNALRWRITGDTAHGDTARDILNAWSATLRTITGNADRFLAAGIYGYQFANAAEIMRGYTGFDLGRFQAMLLEVFYPLNDQFLTDHNGACITKTTGRTGTSARWPRSSRSVSCATTGPSSTGRSSTSRPARATDPSATPSPSCTPAGSLSGRRAAGTRATP